MDLQDSAVAAAHPVAGPDFHIPVLFQAAEMFVAVPKVEGQVEEVVEHNREAYIVAGAVAAVFVGHIARIEFELVVAIWVD